MPQGKGKQKTLKVNFGCNEGQGNRTLHAFAKMVLKT